jgi:hypothetical protein
MSILPLSAIPSSLHKSIQPCQMTFNGIGTTSAMGTIFGRLSFRGTTHYFHNVRFYIVKQNMPCILGRDFFIGNNELKAGDFALVGSGLKLTLQNGRKICVPWSKSPSPSGTLLRATSTAQLQKQLLEEHEITIETDLFTGGELDKLVNLVYEYRDIFNKDSDPIGEFKTLARIPTVEGLTRAQRERPIPKHQHAEVKEQIDQMAREGVIEPCANSHGFNSPLIAVRKKNGKLRVCSDFKSSLNQVLTETTELWPLPSMDTLFANIQHGRKIFSSLDLSKAYWNIKIDSRDRHKTCFTFDNKAWQYTRLPFGLKFSGDAFCKAISEMLAQVKLTDHYANYVDDILAFSPDCASHLDVLRQIFAACRQYGARLGAKKCSFGQSKVTFMGRNISAEGISIPPENMANILALKQPTTRKQLQSLIGNFCWLKNWISANLGEPIASNCFSDVMSEITRLNKPGKKFIWTSEADFAFEQAKKRIASEKVFALPDFRQPFCLLTDASDRAAGAVLMQKIDGRQRLISVSSKSFNETERRWSATERECYALVHGCEKFSYYLKGPLGFVCLVDHKALLAIDKKFLNNSKLQRWQCRLAEFKMTIQYVEGRSHVFADMLSRPFDTPEPTAITDDSCAGRFYKFNSDPTLKVYIPSWVMPNEQFKRSMLLEETDQVSDLFTVRAVLTGELKPGAPILEMREIEQAQSEDLLVSAIHKLVASSTPIDKWSWPDDVYGCVNYKKHAPLLSIHESSNLLIINWGEKKRIVIPDSLVSRYCKSAHDDRAHLGVDRTAQFLNWAWWPYKLEDIRSYVSSCSNCLMQKGFDMQPSRPDQKHLYRASRPHEIVYCDFISLKSSNSGKKYCLTVMCGFSRWLQVYPTSRCRSIDAARALMNYFLQFDFPKILSSDRGKHFDCEVLADLCRIMKIKQNLHVSYRPESSGVIERCHKVLKSALWGMCRDNPHMDWEMMLPSVVSAMNRSINAATKISPYKCLYGRDPTFNGVELVDSAGSRDPESYARTTAEVLDRAHKFARLAQEATDKIALDRGKSKVVPEEITAGHFVMLKRELAAAAKPSKQKWLGPFRVLQTDSVILQIDYDGKQTWVHRYHVVKAKLRPAHIDPDLDDLYDEPEPTPSSSDKNQGSPAASTSPSSGSGASLRRSSRSRRPPDRLGYSRHSR